MLSEAEYIINDHLKSADLYSYSISISEPISFSCMCLQVAVWHRSCRSSWSPVMWSPWGNASSCWTVVCRGRSRSWSRGVKTVCLYPAARGLRCWQMARCSSGASRNAGRGVTRTWASTTARPKIATACWSAAKPKSFWRVSGFLLYIYIYSIQIKCTLIYLGTGRQSTASLFVTTRQYKEVHKKNEKHQNLKTINNIDW